ncbi:N-acetyltransferase [Breoghania sp.]|uniref:GNAT family N-acetyltransferase n=1 Tax=Breoghania sp. TaxID=2065378 RepID=UPI002AA8B71E|nr:N-acetyltransferase [Breoghania sp.]
MIDLVDEAPWHVPAREGLLDRVFGQARYEKPSERLREGRLPEIAISAMMGGDLVGTVRLWRAVTADGRPALLLGPLAVSPELQGVGLGGRLMRAALNRAAVGGHEAVILVGDPGYYARFGFTADHTGALGMPGRYEQRRLLALELVENALAGSWGTLAAAAPLASVAPTAPALGTPSVDLGPWPQPDGGREAPLLPGVQVKH